MSDKKIINPIDEVMESLEDRLRSGCRCIESDQVSTTLKYQIRTGCAYLWTVWNELYDLCHDLLHKALIPFDEMPDDCGECNVREGDWCNLVEEFVEIFLKGFKHKDCSIIGKVVDKKDNDNV